MDARKSSAMFVRALIRAWAGIGIVLLAGMPLVRAETVHAPARTVQLDIALAPPGRLPWVSFDERSGLPQHTIVDLVTDERGFVWAATQDGAARFNGQVRRRLGTMDRTWLGGVRAERGIAEPTHPRLARDRGGRHA